jgi:hypothetical protein
LIEHFFAAFQQAAKPGFGMTVEVVRRVDDAERNVLRGEHDKTPNAQAVPIKNNAIDCGLDVRPRTMGDHRR